MESSGKCSAAGQYGLAAYIANHFEGNQRAFAKAQGVLPQQVTQWVNKGFIVVNDELYSPRRKLKRAI